MSKYTTELRYICESLSGLTESEGYQSVNDVIQSSRTQIFNFTYPIFDNTYKPVLETKILKHYYGREIGAETFGRWQLWLDTRLNEIMPYYNKLYESELIEFNPLYDVDLTTDYVKQGENTGTETNTIDTDTTDRKTITEEKDNTGTIADVGTNSNTKTNNLTDGTIESGSDSNVIKNNRWDIFSDTPQGSLANIKTGDGAYLTNARNIVDDGTGSSITYGKHTTLTKTGSVTDQGTDENTRTLNTSEDTNATINGTGTVDTNIDKEHTINTTEEYLHHVRGKSGGVSYSKLIQEFRETFLNIDMMIIKDLSDLFFGLW